MSPAANKPEIAQTRVRTRSGRRMPLYLAGEDTHDDHYSDDSLDSSKDELDGVTPDPPPPGRPADRDADFARDAAMMRAADESPAAARSVAPGQAALFESTDAPQTRIVHAQDDGGPGPGPEIMAADTLQGDRVINLEGELLGKIRDIMIDVRQGRIAYAVMSSGGVVGFGDRLYAVPWSALTLDAGQHCFVLDISRDRLQAAPGFDRDRWPSMADPAFARTVHDYYGRPSYWQMPL